MRDWLSLNSKIDSKIKIHLYSKILKKKLQDHFINDEIIVKASHITFSEDSYKIKIYRKYDSNNVGIFKRNKKLNEKLATMNLYLYFSETNNIDCFSPYFLRICGETTRTIDRIFGLKSNITLHYPLDIEGVLNGEYQGIDM